MDQSRIFGFILSMFFGVFMILSSHLAVPVIGGGLVELLSQLEGDLCVFEGALGADHHLVSLLADDHSGLGDISNLTGGEANT